MKKTKLLVCLFVAALLAMSVLCVSAFANTSSDAAISIESYNVAFSGELHLFYAVNTSLANSPEKVGVKLSYSPETVEDREVFEAKGSKTEYTPNPAYPTFYSFGIPAKRLVEVVYATPYAEYDDGSVVYGEEVAYSVLEYCYEMILDDAPAKLLAGEITEKKCTDMQNSLRSLLEYGENVQKYFEWNTENLPSDYCYITVDGGTVNGESYIFFRQTEDAAAVKLTCTENAPAGSYFSGWLAEYVDGTVEEVGFDIDGKKSARYSPVYTEIDIETFDDTTYENITLHNPNGPGLGSDGTTDAVKFRFLDAKDPKNSANKVLRANTNSISYGYASNTAVASSITINNQVAPAADNNENVYRFETKLYFASAIPNGGTGDAYGKPVSIDLIASDGSSFGTYYLHQLSGSYLTVRTPGNQVVCSSNSAFSLDKWVTLRIEIYKSADSANCTTKFTLISGTYTRTGEDKSFVANNAAFTDAAISPTSVKMSFVKETDKQRDVYIDDIYFTTIDGKALAN